MSKQIVSITVFICTISVTVYVFGKVDAYITESASYSWTDSDLDNIIPDENDDTIQWPDSYFSYSFHDNENMNKEQNDAVEEVVVPLSTSAELSLNKDNDNETIKSEEMSQKEFMNDVHQLINTLEEESSDQAIPFNEIQEQKEELQAEVSDPLLDEELKFDPIEEIELVSVTVPESQKDVTENKLQKEILSAESNPVLLSAFPKESSNKDFFKPSKNDDLVRNQKSIIPSLITNENGGTGEIILEMDLFPVENKIYHSNLFQKIPLLPFLFHSRLPDTTVAHAWQSFIYPTTTHMHHSAPSTKFYFSANRELNDNNARKILNSLKAASFDEMEYQPLGEHLLSSPIDYDHSADIYRHTPYHNGDVSYGSLDFGGVLHGGTSINNLQNKYMHKNPRSVVPSVEAVTELEVLMNPTKRLLRKMMVLEPPALLHIEPVICHRAYKHPQTHIVF